MLDVVLTRDDANSDSALLVEWLVDHRAQVGEGQPICVIETSKSALEIEAPGSGMLWHLAREGEEVELGSRIAAVAVVAADLAELEQLSAGEPTSPAGPASAGKATRKAVELARAHGIDLSTIAKRGFVTAEDVLAVLAVRGEPPQQAGPGGVSVERVSLPDVFLSDDGSLGALDPTFAASLRADPRSFAALPAAERLELYRRHGAAIGEGVVLGEGAVVVAPRIVLGDGVEIGADGRVECDEVVSVGALTVFGARLRLRCRRAFVGAGGYFTDEVEIGGGGAGDPQALLVIGDLAYVGSGVFINPCRPVVIGREAFVTMRSVLITHNVGHSLLEGFENRFAPIVLEDRVQVGIGAVVYAGCRIGAESIVASNSYVVSDIPPGRLAIGVPARAVAAARRTLSRSQQAELARGLLTDLREQLELRGHAVEQSAGRLRIEHGEASSQVVLVERLDETFSAPAVSGETIVLTLELSGAAPGQVAVLDLLARRLHGQGGVVLETVRELCRKRGIRFEPGPWRYAGGLL